MGAFKKIFMGLFIIIFLLLLIKSCEKNIECNKPYIRFEDKCCLDKNSNNVCDQHEGLKAPREKAEDLGDFKVFYDQTDRYKDLRHLLKKSGIFEKVAGEINNFLALPYDIPIVFTECGEINAKYGNGRIKMCYELTDYLISYVNETAETDEELYEKVLQINFFFMFHELGHALIDVYGLPVTGAEEDSVDRLATIILIDSEESVDAALNTAIWFSEVGTSDFEKLPMWDTHPLEQQRFYNILCLIYGKYGEKYSYLIDDGYLPKDRARSCKKESEKNQNGWGYLLMPYFMKEV